MTDEDRRAIDDLFERLNEAERQNPSRDSEAEEQISRHLQNQPHAPYYLSQVVLVQEHALRQARERIETLEQEQRGSEAFGGFLGGLFGGRDGARGGGASRGSVPRTGQGAASAGPFQRAQPGSFLGGAMQTAVGVAGGLMLGSFLAGMVGGDEAAAGEAGMDEDMAGGMAEEPRFGEDPGDPGGADMGGFDLGDF